MRILRLSRRMLHLGRRLARDEGGAVLIYVSIALTVFMGFAALVIDGGRLFTLDTELQSHADALALAGAAELDGSTGAWTRANAAMANLVQNKQTFGTGAAAITGYMPRFLKALPANDALPITAAFNAANAAESRFVEVTVTTRNISTMFAPAIGGAQTAGTSAVAVAGFTSAVCKFTPLFMCNPYETTDKSLAHFQSQMSTQAGKRKIIALKRSGNGASYVPGNFGFLDPETGNGANALGESLARVDPGTCYRQDGVETKTGSVNSVHRDINVRFDLYDNGVPGNWKNSADFRPAQNVTKGYTVDGNGANAACNDNTLKAPPQAMGFPPDSVVDPDTRLGNGVWDFDAYWDVNHGNGNGNYTDDDDIPEGKDWANTDDDRPTRYEVYRWEIDEEQIPDNSATGGENGNAQCNRNGVSDAVDRRVIYAAVINCTDVGLSGGSDPTVPALTFVKMFMTQPMTKGNDDEDDTLFVELVDIVKPGTADEVVHDIVQLYR
jgi:Flp pilus assembly protein TadG